MKKMIKFTLAAFLLMGLVACTSNTGNEPAPTEKPEVLDPTQIEATITFSWWGGESRHEATIAAVAAFQEKYPNIKVETNYGAWSGWEDAQSMALYSKTAADVMQVNWNWINAYSEDGSNFVDLRDYSSIIDLTQFPQASLDACIEADELQAAPISTTGRVFFWNEAAWEAAGLALPTSMDEFIASGETFKTVLGDDYYPLVVGEYDRIILMVSYLESVYGKTWVENGQLQYSKEEIIEGLEWITMLEEKHVIPTIATITGDGAESIDKNPRWIDGHYGGIYEWDSSFSKMDKALDENQKLVVGDYFPMGDYQGGFAKVSMGFAINENSANKEAAALLINFLLNEAEGIELMGTERGIPLSAVAKEQLGAAGSMDEKVLEANTKMLSWVQFQLDPKFEAASLKTTKTGVYYEVFENLSYGLYTAEQAADVLINGISEELGN